MTNELRRVYLNNEPFLHDEDAKLFTHEMDRTRTLTEEDLERGGGHPPCKPEGRLCEGNCLVFR